MSRTVIEHRLIIRRHQAPLILLQAQNGGWGLPAFASEEHHTADVDFINAAVRQRCGIDVTVLRCLRHDVDATTARTERVFELESHSSDALPAAWRWCASEDLPRLHWSTSADAELVHQWFGDSALAAEVHDGPEWTRPGWWDEARGWIEAQLARLGAGAIQETRQVRVWEFSCVFQVQAAAAGFYFKAVPESLARECDVTVYLSRTVGGCIPQVVATEPSRRWMLMRAAPGVNLEATTDRRAWQHAVAAYGQLQVDSIEQVEALRKLGCPERSLDGLGRQLDLLLADTQAFLCGEPEGLRDNEIEHLRRAGPDLKRRCEQLAASSIPPTLDHGDLWPGNILVDGTVVTVIDWEDAAIAHPFMSVAPLLAGVRVYHPSLDVERLTADLTPAYLAPFHVLAAADAVENTFALARPLATLDLAVRYWRQPPSVVRMHPWMRENVPWLLRIMLSELER